MKKCIGGGVGEGDSPQINVPFQSPASFSGNRSKLDQKDEISRISQSWKTTCFLK